MITKNPGLKIRPGFFLNLNEIFSFEGEYEVVFN